MNKFWRPNVQFVDRIQYTAYYILYYVQYIIFNNVLYVWNFLRIDLWFSTHTIQHLILAKGLHSQGYGLPNGHIGFGELDRKEGRAAKNWCLQTVVLEKTPESPLDSEEIKPVNLKGNEPWILIGRTDAKTEAPVFWSRGVNSQLIGKVCDAGKDWGQKEKRTSENEMAGWHYWWNGYELGQTLGDSEGQDAWHAAVHGVAKSSTQLSNWSTTVTHSVLDGLRCNLGRVVSSLSGACRALSPSKSTLAQPTPYHSLF